MSKEREAREREAHNRIIAEWLGWHVTSIEVTYTDQSRYAVVSASGERHEGRWIYPTPEEAWQDIPDFYTDPAATLMLLKAMLLPTLDKRDRSTSESLKDGRNIEVWMCYAYGCEPVEDPDIQTAVVLAALRLIENDKENSR